MTFLHDHIVLNFYFCDLAALYSHRVKKIYYIYKIIVQYNQNFSYLWYFWLLKGTDCNIISMIKLWVVFMINYSMVTVVVFTEHSLNK